MNELYEFERAYESASVSGYMQRLYQEICFRLMSRGISVNRVMSQPDSFIMTLTDHRQNMCIIQVSCVDNEIIQWRRYA
ncbi:putative uncharacterised protein [Salmonella phage Vi01]|uniref:Uncharacterized protein n=5 Tax=Kuttervirus TaxID=2169536 RepID=E1XT26_BPSAV|nr:putative uncharacterised protein [Salmonella phage Vi01]YP_009021344.1 hypothetical protein DF52_gp098 [Salmonella phage vB-SalM-SJ2]YP_009101462.1 hypothetical protein PI33_gp066 [Escherichia phage ECML-4]YP_009617811.1 hypothetical protein FDI91_gp186 [Salmonella phage STML-13-1]AGF88506.1 hypothetical protein SP063_00265 [Salmonella phage FSL SP-063]EBI9227044.1 hypothetical protein [Salmonella enterica]QPI15220.1 hypothetical protein GECvBN6_gp017 [Salmonella phage GEC_vB_N6]QPX74112.